MPRCRFLWCRKIHFPKSIRVPFDLGNLIKMGLSQRVSEVVSCGIKTGSAPFFWSLEERSCDGEPSYFGEAKRPGIRTKKIFICTDNVRALMALFLQLLRAHENKLLLCSMLSPALPQRRKREPSSRLGTSAPGVSLRLSSRSERTAVVRSSKPKAVTRSDSERDYLSPSQCDSRRRPLPFTRLAEAES